METFTWTHDRGISAKHTPRVLKAQFGDGYAQRALDGLNAKESTWEVRFANRSTTEATAILDFLDARQGVEAFLFTPTGAEAPVKVIAVDWAEQAVSQFAISVKAKFERTY